MVTLDNLTVSYRGHPALHHISDCFAPGSLTAVIGPNGSGKSTLLKSIAGLLPVSGGIVRVSAPSTRIAYLPQLDEIDRGFPINVHDCLLLGSWRAQGAWGKAGRDQFARVESTLACVGLQGFNERPIQSLSSGQLQRVFYARMMRQDADRIVLDCQR